MKRPHQVLLAAVLLTAWPALAQKLPEGELHSYRERTYDVLRYKAELKIDPAARSVEGQATIELQPLVTFDSLELDAIGLDVSSVVLGGSSLEHKSEGHHLKIDFPQPRKRGEPFAVTVAYSARPDAGMYFQADRKDPDRVFVHTYGEGGLLANWLPIYNDTNDQFPSEMVVTVPKPYVAISNGVLDETREDGGWTTYDWRQELPHPNYLIAIYVGDFEMGTLDPAFGEIPLRYWVPRGRLDEGAYAFRNTTRMVEFFSRRLGYRYPWDKYDQIAVPDYGIGAMEHTGVTGHSASVLRHEGEAPLDFGPPSFEEAYTPWSAEATISHELAHHWFGDNLTCRSLNQIWLNESFASYMMMLWDEESVGHEQLLFDVELARRHYLRYVEKEHVIRPLEYDHYDNPDVMYNEEHTYLKGAAVLHMLRGILGDDAFFAALKAYLHGHEHSNVESGDFRRAVEEASGKNLSWFFDDWVHGGGHPVLEVGYRYLKDRGAIDLSVAQVQPIVEGQGLFKLPVEVTIAADGELSKETVWIEKESEHFLLPVPAKPKFVSFDGAGRLVADVRFDKELEELVAEAADGELVGRLRALDQLAARFPTRPETLSAFDAVLAGGGFWALPAEAAELLGRLRTPAAENLAEKALASPDYRIRKAAVLGLAGLGTETARRRLTTLAEKDPKTNVAGTAILALARTSPDLDTAFLRRQLGRDSWYDEIRLATLLAAAELDRPEIAELARPYTGPAWNQEVRKAALAAWEKAAPQDKELHAVLLGLAGGPILKLRSYAIGKLGELYVEDAVPVLEEIVERDVDHNLTVLARKALKEIHRIRPAS